MTGWPAHLAELADAVARARSALASPGDTDITLDFPAPAPGLGPLTAHDGAAALLLLEELGALLAELAEERDRVGRELRLHERLALGRAIPGGSSYVDCRG